MRDFTLFARYEKTTDSDLLTHPAGINFQDPYWQDVVFYLDPDCTRLMARILWHNPKPDRRNKWYVLNTVRYALEWVSPATEVKQVASTQALCANCEEACETPLRRPWNPGKVFCCEECADEFDDDARSDGYILYEQELEPGMEFVY